MKHFYPIAIFNFVLTLITVIPAKAQCPAGSVSNTPGLYTNGETVCISATVTGDITLNNGSKMVVVSGGKFTGNITARNGSEIIVKKGGEFSPNQANTFSATLTNDGTTQLGASGISLTNGASVTNTGTLTWRAWNQSASVTVTNSACGTMNFNTSINLNNSGSAIVNNGKMNFLSDVTISTGTSVNNRGVLYVKGNFSTNGRIYNQYKMVMLGNTSLSGDSVINLYQMVFKTGFNCDAKIRNEGLFWVGGSLTFNSSAALKMNNANAQLRIAGALMNNIPITSSGMLYVAGAAANNNTIQGISSSQKIQVNQTINNASTNVQLNTSMTAYDTTNYFNTYANPDICPTTLPVELSPLQASYKNKAVQLSWYTVTEANTQAFFIEFSSNGVDFTAAGSIAAAGNSNSRVNYNYTHNTTAGGTLYYRVREVDADGRTTYSNITSVKIAGTVGVATSIYPNPFTEKVNFTITLETSVPVTVALYDANGRMIQKVIKQGQAGSNQVSLNGLNALVPGIYLASITAGNQNVVQKLVK